MKTSIISIATDFGVVCASNTSKSPMRLSDKLPVIIAFDPNAIINWEMIVNTFLKQETDCDTFDKLANSFVEYVKSLKCSDVCNKSAFDNFDNKIVLMGYDNVGMYPFVYNYECQCSDGKISLASPKNKHCEITTVDFSCIGSTKYIFPLIPGAFKQYSDCSLVPDMFINYLYEFCDKNKAFIDDKLNISKAYSDEQEKRENFAELLVNETSPYKSIKSDFLTIEELAVIAKKLVNAEVRIDHLYNGGEKPELAKHIQIITLNEGITSISK